MPERTEGGPVHVEPSGITIVVGADETVLAAAERLGYRWPTVCGGLGTCRTCVMTVLEGAEHCSDIDRWEAEGLAEAGLARPGQRLACQARVSGEVRVRKPGVRPA